MVMVNKEKCLNCINKFEMQNHNASVECDTKVIEQR